jgi:hypothetical protein
LNPFPERKKPALVCNHAHTKAGFNSQKTSQNAS